MQNQENNKDIEKSTKGAGFTPPPRPQTMQDPARTNLQENPEKLEDDKPSKPKKEKKPLTEKQKATIKKVSILGSIALVLVVGLAIAISVIVGAIKENTPLVIDPASGKVSLVTTQDENLLDEYFLIAPYQSHADIYIFEIKPDSREATSINIDSTKNVTSVSGIFSTPGVYQVRYAIQKKDNPNTISEYSIWTRLSSTQQLETPNFEYDEQTQTFSWQEVENADAYQLYYFKNDQLENILINEFEVENGLINIALEDLEIDKGLYEFTLLAVNTQKEYFIASDYNKKIQVQHYEKLSGLLSGNYNLSSNNLTVILETEKTNIKLKISYGNNQSITINLADNVLIHSFNLSNYNNLSFDATDWITVSLVSDADFVFESEELDVTLSN